MVERRPYKAKVYGSSPYGPIIVKTLNRVYGTNISLGQAFCLQITAEQKPYKPLACKTSGFVYKSYAFVSTASMCLLALLRRAAPYKTYGFVRTASLTLA